jgi:hypothetical protein
MNWGENFKTAIYFAGYEEIRSLHNTLFDFLGNRLADFVLIFVHVGAINVSVADVNCRFNGSFDIAGLGLK